MSIFRKKNIDNIITNAKSNGLKKSLNVIDLIFLGIGAIIGTGIFVLTGTGAVQAGPGLTISFIIAAIACTLSALSYAEFSSAIPVAGSIYTYSYVTLGEFVAWMIGWDIMLEYGLASSAVAVGWSGYLQSLLHGFGLTLPQVITSAPGSIPGVVTWFNLPAFIIILLVTTLLSIGIKESTRINNIMVFVKVGIILLVIGFGLFHINYSNWKPFIPHGWNGVFNSAAVMFFAFIGFDAISAAAEEVKNPERDLPIGIISSLSICTFLYVAVAAIATGIIKYEKYANNISNPISYGLQSVGENWIAYFIDIGAVFGMLTVILVMCYSQTRILFAMSRDGLLPKLLSSIHKKYGTPFITTWIVGIFFGTTAALIPLNILAELINIGTLAAFSMVSVAVLVLRNTHPKLKRPFKCPGVPITPILSIFICLFLMCNLKLITWISFLLWLSIGLIIYFTFSKKNSNLEKNK